MTDYEYLLNKYLDGDIFSLGEGIDAYMVVTNSVTNWDEVNVIIPEHKTIFTTHKQDQSGYLPLYPEIYKV